MHKTHLSLNPFASPNPILGLSQRPLRIYPPLLLFSLKDPHFLPILPSFLNLKLLLLKQSLKYPCQRLTLSLLPRRWLRLLRKSHPSVRRFLLLLWWVLNDSGNSNFWAIKDVFLIDVTVFWLIFWLPRWFLVIVFVSSVSLWLAKWFSGFKL